ncbi:hypothetical protein [Streptomyces boninensis]|uniref:hypothetical protein n=1 Tax=Streptomyces boninensis TaxID=2039455 RepID=UPI003B219B34
MAQAMQAWQLGQGQGQGRPQPQPGGGAFAAWLAGALALAAEAASAATAGLLWSLQDEFFVAGGAPAFVGYLVMLVAAVIATALVAGAGSIAVVLPLHLLSRWAVRRMGREDRWWWCLATTAAAAAAVALVAALTALVTGGPALLGPLLWLILVAVLGPATLVARAAATRGGTASRWGVVGLTVAGGAALWVAVLGSGIVAYATGLLKGYEAPRLGAAELAGTWTDGDGGTLRLTADGTATAHIKGGQAVGYDKEETKECIGTGRWTGSLQGDGIDLTIVPCDLSGLTFGGTHDKPTLYDWIGDPDSGNRQILTRQG